MRRSKERHKFSPRRGKMARPPSWCLQVEVHDGEGTDIFSREIYFGAFNGGVAKAKAMPKLQSFAALARSALETMRGSRIKASLEKVPENGHGNGQAPSYMLRERYTYFDSLISAKRPSNVFKVSRNGHKGGNGRKH